MKTNTRLRSLLVILLLCSNALVLLLSGSSLERSREAHELRARTQTQNLAKALDQTLANSVEKIDQALLTVADELERQLAAGQIDEAAMMAFIGRHAARHPDIEAFRVADADGLVILGKGVDQRAGVSWSDRDYFLYHRDHDDHSLQIAKPRMGRIAKTYIIGFSRRYNFPDGRFAGVVSAPIAVNQLGKLLGDFNLGPLGTAVLRDTELGLVTRIPAIPDKPAGQIGNTVVSVEFAELVRSGVPTATYFTPASADGMQRINTFIRLSRLPMILVVGTSKDDYLAAWHSEVATSLAIAGGYLLLSLLAGNFIFRLLRQNEVDRQTLADREARLKTIVENEPECIKIVDAEGRLLEMNPAGLKFIEAESLAQVAGHPVIELIAPEYHAAFLQLHQRVLAGEVATLEFEIIGLAGTRRWMDTHAKAIRDGQQTLHLAVTRDISQRKRAEATLEEYRRHLEQLVVERSSALLATEARASHILSSSADGIYGLDAAGLITFINPAACQMLGYTPEAVIGQSAHALFHHSKPDGSPYPSAECPAHRGLQAGLMVRSDNEVYWHADGHAVPVMYAVHPVMQEGQPTGAVTSFVDISEQRATAQAREQALIAAENLARIRSEFLANMSHEIRTPLNGILGFAEIGQRNFSNPHKAQDAFSKIQQSGKRLLGVINDILDFSKIEAGKLNIELIPVAIPELIDHCVELLSDRAERKNLEFCVALDGKLPQRCLTDPLRLGQVLINITGNAVKFTEHGRVTIRVGRSGDELYFRVEDTGIGMTPEQQAQLFNPFQQADASSTRRFGGTGLGLAISKRIIELMHGTISVSSEIERGTVVEFRIPCRETAPASPATPPAAPAEAPREPQPLAGYAILVAEDEPINQAILLELLGDLGASLTLADNGRQALDTVKQNGAEAYDLVLMDVQMPEMDGYEAARRIHELAPALPIIAQTAHAFSEERERCYAAGMIGHVAKPLDMDDLLRLIVQEKILPATRKN